MPIIGVEWNQTQDVTNWIKPIEIKYLLKDNLRIKSISNNELIDLGINISEDLFLEYGVDDLTEFIGDTTETIQMQDQGILGEGKLFKASIPFFFDRVDKIEVVG